MGGSTVDPETLLRDMFAAAVAAAQPEKRIPLFLPTPPDPATGGRTLVIGAGDRIERPLDPELLRYFRELGIVVELMNTLNACATFNIHTSCSLQNSLDCRKSFSTMG